MGPLKTILATKSTMAKRPCRSPACVAWLEERSLDDYGQGVLLHGLVDAISSRGDVGLIKKALAVGVVDAENAFKILNGIPDSLYLEGMILFCEAGLVEGWRLANIVTDYPDFPMEEIVPFLKQEDLKYLISSVFSRLTPRLIRKHPMLRQAYIEHVLDTAFHGMTIPECMDFMSMMPFTTKPEFRVDLNEALFQSYSTQGEVWMPLRVASQCMISSLKGAMDAERACLVEKVQHVLGWTRQEYGVNARVGRLIFSFAVPPKVIPFVNPNLASPLITVEETTRASLLHVLETPFDIRLDQVDTRVVTEYLSSFGVRIPKDGMWELRDYVISRLMQDDMDHRLIKLWFRAVDLVAVLTNQRVRNPVAILRPSNSRPFRPALTLITHHLLMKYTILDHARRSTFNLNWLYEVLVDAVMLKRLDVDTATNIWTIVVEGFYFKR